MTRPHISTQELKDAYTRAHLWRIGISFDQAQSIGAIRICLENSALAARRRRAIPSQLSLI